MTSPVKKSKKKGGGKPNPKVYDYKALLPADLDEKTQDLMERFLRNEEVPHDERGKALDVFVKAVLKEQKKLAEEDAEKERQKANEKAAPNATHESSPESLQTSQPDDFVPNPDCLSEERQRINVGWMAGPSDAREDVDKKIATYSQRLGCQLYNFVSYPIGGVRRGFWTPKGDLTDNPPPCIDLPDLQLQNHLWETYVNGVISEWIDCDSQDEQMARLSEQELVKELNYAAYMGLRSVVVSLRRADSPRLAEVLNKWLWTRNLNMALWVFVPTSVSELIRPEGDERDVWEIWADFRTSCCNFSSNKLIVGLHASVDIDDEFIEPHLRNRWKAEPLAAFWLESSMFVTDPTTNKARLPNFLSSLLQNLWMSDNARAVVRGPRDSELPANVRLDCSQAIRAALRDVVKRKGIAEDGFLADGNIDYMDVLQAPLQPLADNLDSNVYNTFEQDPIKYKRYREAVEACLKDLGEAAGRPEELVLYVLGAGRGPLVTASLEAERNYNERYRSRKDRLKLKVFVVEKNSNAIVTLRFMNERVWKCRCKVIESDMRSLPALAAENGYPQPDIIVSELLGSFGDNELSPECLDGVTPFLKPTTISIPQSYTSYAAPIMSCHMHQTIRGAGASYWNSGIPGHGREGPKRMEDGTWKQEYRQGQRVANMDQIYVVFLRQYCPLAEAKAVFTFDHPNFACESNERRARVAFEVDRAADIMGFAGYFHMNLYKDVVLSIEPSSYSKGMISWFPALIPLRTLHRVHRGEKVTLVIERKVDEKGVWYEWQLEHKTVSGETQRTVLQNENGESYYMKC